MRTVRNQAYSDAFELRVSGGGGGGVILECLGGREGGGAWLLKETKGKQNTPNPGPWFPISWNLTVFQTQTVKICTQFQVNHTFWKCT